MNEGHRREERRIIALEGTRIVAAGEGRRAHFGDAEAGARSGASPRIASGSETNRSR